MQEKKIINVEIGQRIKRQRECAGLTQETFAEMIGLGVKHVSAMDICYNTSSMDTNGNLAIAVRYHDRSDLGKLQFLLCLSHCK